MQIFGPGRGRIDHRIRVAGAEIIWHIETGGLGLAIGGKPQADGLAESGIGLEGPLARTHRHKFVKVVFVNLLANQPPIRRIPKPYIGKVGVFGRGQRFRVIVILFSKLIEQPRCWNFQGGAVDLSDALVGEFAKLL